MKEEISSRYSQADVQAQRRPFVNQRRLLPWAVLAAAGLVAVIVTGAIVVWELVDAFRLMADLNLQAAVVPAVNDPVGNSSTFNFGVAFLGAFLLFSVWLILAYRNLGKNAVGPRCEP